LGINGARDMTSACAKCSLARQSKVQIVRGGFQTVHEVIRIIQVSREGKIGNDRARIATQRPGNWLSAQTCPARNRKENV